MQIKKIRYKIRVLILAYFILFNFTTDIFAHGKEDKKSNDWEPISAGPLTTWTAPLCGKGKFVIQPFFFYNRTRGVFNSEGHYDSLPKGDKKYQYQQQLFMQYGLTEELEIDAQTVYQENYREQGNQKAHSHGFGDSYIFLRYCAVEESKTLPHITGLLQLKIPTGKYQKLDPDKLGTDSMGATSGGGSYDLGFGFNLTKKLKPFIIHLDVIYSFPQDVKIDGINTGYGRYLNYDFGVEYFLFESFNPALSTIEEDNKARKSGFNLMLEFNGFLQGDKKENNSKMPATDLSYLTVAPGIGWSNNKIQMLLAYQRILTGKNTDANDSVVLTLVYAF